MGTSLLWGQGSPRVQLSAPQTQKALDQGLFLPWILPRSMDPNFYSIPETFCSAFPPSSILFIFHYSLQSPHSRVGRQESSWPRERRKTGWMPLAAPSRPQLCPPRPSSLRTPAPLWGPTRAIALGGDTHIHGRQTLARGGGGRAGTALVPPAPCPLGQGEEMEGRRRGPSPPASPSRLPPCPVPGGRQARRGPPLLGAGNQRPGARSGSGGGAHTPSPSPRRGATQSSRSPPPSSSSSAVHRAGGAGSPGPGRAGTDGAPQPPAPVTDGSAAPGGGSLATAPWQRRHGNGASRREGGGMRGAGGGGGGTTTGNRGAPPGPGGPRGSERRSAVCGSSPGPAAPAGRGLGVARASPRVSAAPVRAPGPSWAPGRGGEASPGPPSPGPPRPSGTASPERKPRVSPSSPPHFTRSHELRLTGSCFAARRPLRACPGSARAGAAPRAVSGRTAWQGEPRAVVQETRSKGPGTRAAPGDGASGTPTCEGSSPWTHGRIHTHV